MKVFFANNLLQRTVEDFCIVEENLAANNDKSEKVEVAEQTFPLENLLGGTINPKMEFVKCEDLKRFQVTSPFFPLSYPQQCLCIVNCKI